MNETTYAACLTPPGAGAIAVIAVYGPQAISTVETLFRARCASKCSNHLLALRAHERRFFLGRFGDEISDEVVVSIKQTASVPWVELHCHGGVEIVRLLLETLQRRGVETCSWQELEQRTAADPLRAAAAIELAEARTVRTGAILLDQYHGAFARAVREISALLEARDQTGAGRQLGELAQYSDLGGHLTRPWRVVVAGAPNVGKSSLVNALAGFQRAVVSAIPGTTRDLVTTETALDGWPVELIDTAGLREPGEGLEARGIDRARMAAGEADLCLWVLDASTSGDRQGVGGSFPHGRGSFRFVVNKVDLPAAWDRNQVAHALPVSAVTGEGLAELGEALAGWLVPRPPAAGAAVPFTPELCVLVQEAWQQHAAANWEEARRTLTGILERLERTGPGQPAPGRG